MMHLFHDVCHACSKMVTNRYSTSFSLGIRMFDKRFRQPIYDIYGYVRFADEIVDTFPEHVDRKALLERFRRDTWQAIDEGISLNPILHSFQRTVRQYGIERELIEAFLDSMEMDLYHDQYGRQLYDTYIYGSAEVVGLMCLRVFCENDTALYDSLREPARRLGAAFQKVNFLRDMKSDFDERGRIYFPGVDFNHFTPEDKRAIEREIAADFEAAYAGIVRLPEGARMGVYTAYVYYLELFRKIERAPVQRVKQERIRVPNVRKFYLLARTALQAGLFF
ncbi:MAG: phytoene/squalene synthase family protein [Bacteroidetes bacterium]|nr:MAG: phytoene/squalene synthase family protein [Bacteroidota bacterium]